MQCIQGLFQSTFGTTDYAHVTTAVLSLKGLVVRVTAARFKPLIFSVSGEHVYFYDFG
jgi:hypothetical protein